MPNQEFGDISVFTIGAAAFLGDVKNVSYKLNPSYTDAEGLTSAGKRRQLNKLGGSISVSTFSTLGDGTRVDYLNVTAFTIGGVTYRCDLYRFDVSGSYEQKQAPAFCTRWMIPYNGLKDYTLTCEVAISSNAFAAIASSAHAANTADRQATVSVTINGVTFAIPCVIGDYEHRGEVGELQRISLQFLGQAPISSGTAYPTTPTETTTLLGWCLNDAKTARAFVFKTHATAGATYTGNIIPRSFRFGCEDGGVVMTEYEFATTGPVAVS